MCLSLRQFIILVSPFHQVFSVLVRCSIFSHFAVAIIVGSVYCWIKQDLRVLSSHGWHKGLYMLFIVKPLVYDGLMDFMLSRYDICRCKFRYEGCCLYISPNICCCTIVPVMGSAYKDIAIFSLYLRCL